MDTQENIFIGYISNKNVAVGYSAFEASYTNAVQWKPNFKDWYSEIKYEISDWVSSYKELTNEIRDW